MTAEVLTSGSERPRRRLSRGARAGLAAAGLAAAAVAVVVTRPPAVPAPTLRVVADSAGVTTSGVVVVAVELRGAAPDRELRAAEVTAAPVLQPPTVTEPRRVRPDGTVQLTVIVQPDCRAVDAASPAWEEASLRVRAPVVDGSERDVVLDLRDDPVLLGRLQGLCSRVGQERQGVSVEFVGADERTVTAEIGVDGGAGGAQVRAVSVPGLRVEAPTPVEVSAGAGVSLGVEVTVTDCFAVRSPAPGSDPDAFVWGVPEVELADGAGVVTRDRPEPAAVSDLYSTAVRLLVQTACASPPR